MQLLEGAQFLHGALDPNIHHLFLSFVIDVFDTRGQGKASNFSHPALKKLCLTLYYGTGLKCLYQFEEFESTMPKEALLLIAAIVHFMF